MTILAFFDSIVPGVVLLVSVAVLVADTFYRRS